MAKEQSMSIEERYHKLVLRRCGKEPILLWISHDIQDFLTCS